MATPPTPLSTTYDNRDTCGDMSPSSCVPYTGYISDSIADKMPCRPNVNDVLLNLQILIDKLNTQLGDNTTLDKECFTYNPLTDTQKQLNQELITDICLLQTQVAGLLGAGISADDIVVTANLQCLADPACEPSDDNTLTYIITKLVNNYCSLLDRVVNIESILNI